VVDIVLGIIYLLLINFSFRGPYFSTRKKAARVLNFFTKKEDSNEKFISGTPFGPLGPFFRFFRLFFLNRRRGLARLLKL
jgi:hypothetical protein